MARAALDRLDDLAYVLACAVDDVDRRLAGAHDEADVARELAWLLAAARPLADRVRTGSVVPR